MSAATTPTTFTPLECIDHFKRLATDTLASCNGENRRLAEIEIVLAIANASTALNAILTDQGTPQTRALARSKTHYVDMLRTSLNSRELLPHERDFLETELSEAVEEAGLSENTKRAIATAAFVVRSRSEYPK